jgi:DNA repair protein RecO (recombination protein O)
MPRPLKTEAIVLRSIRYGEADRILHLYTPHQGRLGAIAKGARRARSRFGARLEPFFHIRAVLHEGRGELLTVSSVDTITTHGQLRARAATIEAAARACDAVSRLFESSEPHPEVFSLLANELALLSGGLDAAPAKDATQDAARATAAQDAARATAANGLAFRMKLLLAAGIVPQLGACAACGENEHLSAFSAAAGGVVCSSCEAAAFPIEHEAYGFLVGALAAPLAEAPSASERALRQAERAIGETAEHHAHVRLRPLMRAA